MSNGTDVVGEALCRIRDPFLMTSEVYEECSIFASSMDVSNHMKMNPDAPESKVRFDQFMCKFSEKGTENRLSVVLTNLSRADSNIYGVADKGWNSDHSSDQVPVHVKSWRAGSDNRFPYSGVFAAGEPGTDKPRDIEILGDGISAASEALVRRSVDWVVFVSVCRKMGAPKNDGSVQIRSIVQVRTLHEFGLFKGMVKASLDYKRAVYFDDICALFPDGFDPRVKADIQLWYPSRQVEYQKELMGVQTTLF